MDKEVTGTSEVLSVEKEKYVDVMLTVSRWKSKERIIFVNPAIYGIRWLSSEKEGFWMVIENKPDIESKCKDPKQRKVANGARMEVKIHRDHEDDARRLIDKLSNMMLSPTVTQMKMLLMDEGLNMVEAETVLNYPHISDYLKMELDIKLDGKTDTVEYMTLNFVDREGRRISNTKTIFPSRHQLFSRMKIGPDAGHAANDQPVVRNFYCKHCFKLLGTGTIEEVVKSKEIQELCKECQTIEGNLPEDEEETRSYNITARRSVLNNLEVLFREMWILGVSGASRELRLYVDGDGIVRIETKRTDKDEPLAKNCQKSGVLKRNRYLGEPSENGYLTYLDLG